ncbi:MAG TPA: hypothetical protein VGN63_13420 [Flavisolibacter sp.]|jgi:uncharacterized protein involved in exopolysaccharide biosynthesis|nr:hypothetical protein [Flavisolibacter sp.]
MDSHNIVKNSSEDFYTLGDIAKNAGEFFRYLLRKWPVMLVMTSFGIAAGLGLYYMQKPKYEAECSFILEEKQSGLGGLSGLASQFGLDVGGIGAGGMFSGDNILAILTSRTILEGVLLTKTDSTANAPKLIDIYLEFSGLKQRWMENATLNNVNFSQINRPSDMTMTQDSIMNIVYGKVVENHLAVERISKKGTIISAKVVSENPSFSKLLVKRLVDASKDYYISVKTSVTTANVERLQQKADSLLRLLTNKTYQAAQVQGVDLNPALRTLLVPTEIASRDKTVLATLYSEVVKNLEIARTTLMMQTPVLQILDVPSLSLYDNKKRKLFFIVIGVFAFGVLTTFVLLLRFRFKH